MSRRGHSLVELIVTLVFLGTTLGAVAAGALAATRGTARVVQRQQGVSGAAAILDSLLAHVDPAGGEQRAAGRVLTWTVTGAGRGRAVRVVARDARHAEIAALDGFWVPLPPVLPSEAP
ncbi:MAG: hypothetical protein KY466_07865 [Gemmatimonadetes bacterium]|nr:hypothetical protein [Gemmatimonadota bacterium]